MAASSPVISSNSGGEISGTVNGNHSSSIPFGLDTPKQNLRGLNKPKCTKCGHVARSRCPYQSCKSCCAKAQNPCFIHVLKSNATFPDTSPSSSSPSLEQKSSDVTHSGSPSRVSPLWQISNNFAQFNASQSPLRSKKPLSRKEVAAINEWRFSKLKEYKQRNIEIENEAFDRYMQNVSLLEEVFSISSPSECDLEKQCESEVILNDRISENTALVIKIGLQSDPGQIHRYRQKLKEIINNGLKTLAQNAEDDEHDVSLSEDDLASQNHVKKPKIENARAEQTRVLNDLIDKLTKARSLDELNACMEMKLELFNQREVNQTMDSKDKDALDSERGRLPFKVSDALSSSSLYSMPKKIQSLEISEDDLRNIDNQFSSLDQIADL